MLGRKRFLKSNFAYFKSILLVLIIKKKREEQGNYFEYGLTT